MHFQRPGTLIPTAQSFAMNALGLCQYAVRIAGLWMRLARRSGMSASHFQAVAFERPRPTPAPAAVMQVAREWDLLGQTLRSRVHLAASILTLVKTWSP